MSTVTKLCAYGVALALLTSGAYAIGSAVGPRHPAAVSTHDVTPGRSMIHLEDVGGAR